MAREPMPLGKALMLAERYRREDRLPEAEAVCRQVLEAQPNLHEAEHLLGLIARQNGKLGEAIEHLQRAVKLAPAVALLHANLGEMYRLAGRLDEATAAGHRASELDRESPGPLNNLARIAIARGESQRAIAYCRQALALKPNFADAYSNLGTALKDLGLIEEARTAYLRAIELEPGVMGARVNFAEVHKFVSDDAHLTAMEVLAAKSHGLSTIDRVHLDFALGKAYGDVEDYRRSFQHFLAGNAGRRALINYDEKSTLAMFDHIERVFTRELIEQKSGGGDCSSVPIFVIGMPRSGTTLVEQILASHEQVLGGGEMNAFHEAVVVTRTPDGRPVAGPGFVPALDAGALSDIGARYLAAIRRLAPTAPHITDKLWYNFHLIGLIHLALPNSRIIHVIRDPIDTCVSCFSKLLEIGYANDLAELGRYYKRYERLMAHWQRVLPPGRILDVRYENIVEDIEAETRRMLAYCHLPWDQRCITFHETQRPVRTASATQVRLPIYKSSVGRWRAYKEFIGPLLAELEPVSGDVGDRRT